MKTYIIFWNPSISSCTMEEYQVKLMDIGGIALLWGIKKMT